MKFYHILILAILIQCCFSCKETPAPILESISPTFGPAETLVTFKGMNLENIQTLTFSGQEVNFNNAYNSENALLFRIPTNIPLGDHEVVLTTEGGSVFTNFRMTLEAPEIFDVQPEFATAGETVTILGKNFFDPLEVYFHDSVAADIVFSAPDSMEVVVPDGIEKGRLVVWANGGRALSPKNFFSVNKILVNDFDGNGIRSDTENWIRSGFVDQASPSDAVQNANPTPIDGNFLKLTGKDEFDIKWIGGFENNSNDISVFENFGITNSAGNTLLEMDVHTNGNDKTYVTLIFLERDGSINDFTETILIENDEWERISIPLSRFEDLDGFIVDPSKIKTLKIHLIDEEESGEQLELNVDNIEFVEII